MTYTAFEASNRDAPSIGQLHIRVTFRVLLNQVTLLRSTGLGRRLLVLLLLFATLALAVIVIVIFIAVLIVVLNFFFRRFCSRFHLLRLLLARQKQICQPNLLASVGTACSQRTLAAGLRSTSDSLSDLTNSWLNLGADAPDLRLDGPAILIPLVPSFGGQRLSTDGKKC